LHNGEILVSICCQTFNHERYLRKCLDSFVMQKTDFRFEILVHEDASTDNTAQVLKEYESRYPHLFRCVFQTENQFKKINSLTGILIPMAKGKFVAICEGDDFWTDPLKLQRQTEFLEKSNEYSMCFTDSVIVDENEIITKESRIGENNKKDISQIDILNGFVPPTNTVLIRKENLEKIIVDFPQIANGDYYMSMLLANEGKIGYLNYNTAAYRLHGESTWSRLSEKQRMQNYTKTLISLKGKVQKNNEEILASMISSNLSNLKEFIMEENYTENGYWTPQTAMLRSIRDAILKINGAPKNALSIDDNPTIEKMLLCKWPELEITKTQWPEYDAQNLHQFNDETFDIVFSHQVLEHIPKPWLAASEMNRVLKSGGIGIHSSCAYNPRHGYPAFKDYYRFLPDGLAELFDGINIWVKDGWGSKEALIYNLTIDDGHGDLGGRRFVEALGKKNDENYPWHTWIIFQKK